MAGPGAPLQYGSVGPIGHAEPGLGFAVGVAVEAACWRPGPLFAANAVIHADETACLENRPYRVLHPLLSCLPRLLPGDFVPGAYLLAHPSA